MCYLMWNLPYAISIEVNAKEFILLEVEQGFVVFSKFMGFFSKGIVNIHIMYSLIVERFT